MKGERNGTSARPRALRSRSGGLSVTNARRDQSLLMTFSKWEAGARLTRASRSLFLSIVGRQIASPPRSQHSDYATNPATSGAARFVARPRRSEEHTSELQSLMRISYAVFCLKKKKHTKKLT